MSTQTEFEGRRDHFEIVLSRVFVVLCVGFPLQKSLPFQKSAHTVRDGLGQLGELGA